jgi:peroxiredoxin
MSRVRGRGATCLPIVMLAVSAIALSGCAAGTAGGSAATPTAPAVTTQAGATPSPAGTGVPSAIPDTLRFAAPTVDGGRFDGTTLAGKPAVIWFWAAWCSRCMAKADDVKAVHAQHSSKVNFVGVAGLASGGEAMKRFVDQYGIGAFPQLADDAGMVWRHFGVTEQEFFVVIDAAGRTVHKGPLSDTGLRQAVGSLAG